jgi:hypothetical protein
MGGTQPNLFGTGSRINYSFTSGFASDNTNSNTGTGFEFINSLNITGGTPIIRGIHYRRTGTLGSATEYGLLIENGLAGIGLTAPTAKLHVVSDGTTTGNLALFENSAGDDRLTLLDNGTFTAISDAGSTPFRFRTSSATNYIGFNPGTASSIVFANPFGTVTLAIESGAANHLGIGNAAFQGSIFRLSNSGSADTNAPRISRGGTSSSGQLILNAGQSSVAQTRILFTSVDNGTTGTISLTGTDFSWVRSSGISNNYILSNFTPTINTTGTYTGTFSGYVYNPTLTSVTGLTNYAFLASSGLTGLGTLTPTYQLHVVGTSNNQNLFVVQENGGTNIIEAIESGGNRQLGFWGATPVNQPVGWGTPSGTLTRTTFDTTTATVTELAERLAALISDLKSEGLLGS